jgi:hypothetical protein
MLHDARKGESDYGADWIGSPHRGFSESQSGIDKQDERGQDDDREQKNREEEKNWTESKSRQQVQSEAMIETTLW